MNRLNTAMNLRDRFEIYETSLPDLRRRRGDHKHLDEEPQISHAVLDPLILLTMSNALIPMTYKSSLEDGPMPGNQKPLKK